MSKPSMLFDRGGCSAACLKLEGSVPMTCFEIRSGYCLAGAVVSNLMVTAPVVLPLGMMLRLWQPQCGMMLLTCSPHLWLYFHFTDLRYCVFRVLEAEHTLLTQPWVNRTLRVTTVRLGSLLEASNLVASLLLVAMPGAPSSFLLLVASKSTRKGTVHVQILRYRMIG